MCAVHTGPWTFTRGGQELTLRREDAGNRVNLVVAEGEHERQFSFDDLPRLAAFQADMEALLLRTGWSFVGFSGDRRVCPDRRTFPRLTERRRWWTDGTSPFGDNTDR